LVSLAEGATVIGNIYCTRIAMEECAQFNGKIEMIVPAPLKIAPEPEEVEEEFEEAENLTA
jgi:cytoskeletal protein CcmA (bactofilin family)